MFLLAVLTAAVGVCESATWTLKFVVPVVVGVPLIVPSELRVSPAGRLPEARVQVYGFTPPVAVSVAEYGTLITATVSALFTMFSGRTTSGGLPLPQDCVKISPAPIRTTKRKRFDAVMNVLVAQPMAP